MNAVLRLLNRNRAISGVDGQKISSPVHLPVNGFLRKPAIDGHRYLENDVSVAGVKVQVRGKIGWHRQNNAAVACLEVPIMGKRRTAFRADANPAIPGTEIQRIEAAVGLDMSIPGMSPEGAVDSIHFLAAVPADDLHVSLEMSQSDTPISRSQVELTLARHLNLVLCTVVDADVPADYAHLSGRLDLQFNHISRLMVGDTYPSPTNFPSLRDHPSLDSVLVPGVDGDARVRGLDRKVWLGADGEGFCPFIGECGRWQTECEPRK